MSLTVNGVAVANGIGNCYEEGLINSYSTTNGVTTKTTVAPSPRGRTLILADITAAEAASIRAAVMPAGTTVYLTGDFVPAAAALGHSLDFTAKIDGATGRGIGTLLYETFFATDSSGDIYLESFL